jgi:hypothetical protein
MRSLLSCVIHFEGARANIILFALLRKVQPSLRRLDETHKCSTAQCAKILQTISHKSNNK